MPGSILSAFLDAMEEETELHCIAHAHVSSTKGGKSCRDIKNHTSHAATNQTSN